jgi:hypothetical protein
MEAICVLFDMAGPWWLPPMRCPSVPGWTSDLRADDPVVALKRSFMELPRWSHLRSSWLASRGEAPRSRRRSSRLASEGAGCRPCGMNLCVNGCPPAVPDEPRDLLVGAGLPCASFVTALAAVAGRGESVGCRLVLNSMSRDVAMVSTASAVGAEFRDRQFGCGTTLGRCGCRPLSSHCPCGLRTYEGCWWPAAPDSTRQGRARHSK